MKRVQEIWNREIRSMGRHANRLPQKSMEAMIHESGEFWTYEQSPHNTDAYRDGWDRIFSKKENRNG